MTNTIKIPVGAYESRNDYLITDESKYKVCPVSGYRVYHTHECGKGGC